MALATISNVTEDEIAYSPAQMSKKGWHHQYPTNKQQVEQALFYGPGKMLVTSKPPGTTFTAMLEAMQKNNPTSGIKEYVYVGVMGKSTRGHIEPKPEGAVSKADMLIALNVAKTRIKKHGWARGWGGTEGQGICIGSALGVGPHAELLLQGGPEALEYVVAPMLGEGGDFIYWNDKIADGKDDVFAVLDLAIEKIKDDMLVERA